MYLTTAVFARHPGLRPLVGPKTGCGPRPALYGKGWSLVPALGCFSSDGFTCLYQLNHLITTQQIETNFLLLSVFSRDRVR
jgi:hypothetical protein